MKQMTSLFPNKERSTIKEITVTTHSDEEENKQVKIVVITEDGKPDILLAQTKPMEAIQFLTDALVMVLNQRKQSWVDNPYWPYGSNVQKFQTQAIMMTKAQFEDNEIMELAKIKLRVQLRNIVADKCPGPYVYKETTMIKTWDEDKRQWLLKYQSIIVQA